MPTFKPQLRIPTLRLLSTASRPKEGTTRIINDPASSKAADESRPTTGGGEDALTVEVGSRQVDKQGGEVSASEYATYSKWREHEKEQANTFEKDRKKVAEKVKGG